jgi:hypothetical protein
VLVEHRAYIPPGHFYSLSALEPTILVTSLVMDTDTLVEGLCHTMRLWKHGSTQPKVYKIVPKRFHLNGVVGLILEEGINGKYGDDINHPFSFQTPEEGGEWSKSYGRIEGTNHLLSVEGERGHGIFMIGALAREWSGAPPHCTLKIEGLNRRAWGRLTIWCQAHLGLSHYQDERDHTRVPEGRPIGYVEEETETESE